jgi:hypothetical protein
MRCPIKLYTKPLLKPAPLFFLDLILPYLLLQFIESINFGLDHPRKRACLTALHNFFLTRADGTTVAERFFGQKPRSMFAAILASVEVLPAPLSPPQRAIG